ncbi:MAG: HdeD family acid-resistance protein [Coprobacillaceae bacterium]
MKKCHIYNILHMIVGSIFIFLGILSFLSPAKTMTTHSYIYGAVMLIMGGLEITFYILRGYKSLFFPASLLTIGTLEIVLGMLLISNIWIGEWAITFLFPAWFIILCISRITNLKWIKSYVGDGEYWLSLTINLLGIVVGTIMFLNPIIPLISMSIIISAFLIMIGVEMIVFALGHYQFIKHINV